MSDPTRNSVLDAMDEYSRIGDAAFLKKYTSGRSPKSHYLEHGSTFYPLKALWAAAHKPPVHARSFITFEARRKLAKLGFDGAVQR